MESTRSDCRASDVLRAFCTALALLSCVPAASPSTIEPAASGNPRANGAWSAVQPWPIIPLSTVLSPDGRVLSYGTNTDGKQTGYFNYDIWNPAAGFGAGAHVTLPNTTGTDLFCASGITIPQLGAGVLISGGDIWSGTKTTHVGNNNANVFRWSDESLTRTGDMTYGRWYASSMVLLNGEIYVQGGTSGQPHPEVRSTSGAFRVLWGADTSALHYSFPRNYVAPDGRRIFGFDNVGWAYYVDPTANGGTGAVTRVANLPSSFGGQTSSVSMFRPGRILAAGGTSRGGVVIDITGGGNPVYTATAPMSSERQLVNFTQLPDGTVLATGGSEGYNQLIGVNTSAERWDPRTGLWTVGANEALARLYHSMAILMPDATVLVGGGGAPGPLKNRNVEVYYPPYLYDASGSLAGRPTIVTAPSGVQVGQRFGLDFGNATSISRVTLVKMGAVTHSVNIEQRFVELAFNASGTHLDVQMPSSPADTPPGYYLVFVLDANGVPSVGRVVWINVAAPRDPHAPTIVKPADRNETASSTFTVTASDPDGDPLTFSAGGLPPGITIDSATGLVSGKPTASGTFYPVVAVHDSAFTSTASFVWKTSAKGPLDLAPLPPPAPAQTGNAVTYTAEATGTDPRYSWDFGDGTSPTAPSTSGTVSHTFTKAGFFQVTVTVTDASGVSVSRSFSQIAHLPLVPGRVARSSNIVVETPSSGKPRVWVANPDNDSVRVLDAINGAHVAAIPVGISPRSLAIDASGKVWVTNKGSATISVIGTSSLSIKRTIVLKRGSQPHGIVMSPDGAHAYVALQGLGQVVRFDTATFSEKGWRDVGPAPRDLAVSADGTRVYVSRFITPPQPGESTATVGSSVDGVPTGGEVLALVASNLAIERTIVLKHSTKADGEIQGRGVPNYLGAAAISPDGTQAYVPSKQDNIMRGTLRDGRNLDFQNTVRAISSRINLASGTEDLPSRIDHDNASVASSALFDPYGVFLFVTLETSRELAIIDAHRHAELFRVNVGRAPQGIASSKDGRTLYVSNFMDRSVSVFDAAPLLDRGELRLQLLDTWSAVEEEQLAPDVLAGKQLFYDARDTRLAQDRYLSCATCHNDGGGDGRTWDLTGFGEGLRNTPYLRGRAGGEGFLHWSANFDEVQDFEGQIRNLAGGTGLMADTDFFAGTRSRPLGTPKAGVSTDLDHLAAYVASLTTFDATPFRPTSDTLTAKEWAGKAVFRNLGCGACHGGPAFTGSGANTLVDVGTIKPSSGQRLGGPLTGIDIPTLRDVWETAPYLHDGSAPTLEAAVRAHNGITVSDADLDDLVTFLRAIGREESKPDIPPGGGSGLTGAYFDNPTLTPPAAKTRIEAVDFQWNDAPAAGVGADGFSVRWTGTLKVPITGTYRFQTTSNDGIRVWVNGVSVVYNWAAHSTNVTNTSAPVNLTAGSSVPVVIEYYDKLGTAVARFRWLTPGVSAFAPVPRDRLFPG